MKQLLTYLPIITVCIVYFGFNNLYGYYHEFGIEINHYISSPEIVLSFLPTILILSGFLYSAMFQTILNAGRKKEQPLIEEHTETETIEQDEVPTEKKIKRKSFFIRFFQEPLTWYFLTNLLFALISYGLIRFLKFTDWQIQYWTLFTQIANILFLAALAYLNKGLAWIQVNKIFVLAIAIYAVGNTISEYRKSEAKKLKAGFAILNVEFKRKGKVISSNKNLLYVGQTQAQLFLYDRNHHSTIIYKQSELDSLVIKN